MSYPKFAIIGCGLQTELVHLPITAGMNLAEVAVVVDRDMPRARRLAQKYGIAEAVNDYRKVIGKVDAALLALPNYLHAPVAVDLLRRGVHVLVEKPMALCSSQCDDMIHAAEAGNAILVVGLDFRFPKVSQFAYQVVRNGMLGDSLKFDLRMGKDLTTLCLNSDYLLRKETAGGGVLIDLGVHAVDLILWWLGNYERVRYYDDAMGGVEANCELRLQLQSGSSGIIEVSRTRHLRNTCIIAGERASLEVGLWDRMGLLKLEIENQPISLTKADNETTEDWYDVFRRQFTDFAAAIHEGRKPLVSGGEGRRSIELIDNCYASRQPLPQPWIDRP